ncbi:MAG: hypothetical protein NVS1B13_25450 [Flavisolibacter sp.]
MDTGYFSCMNLKEFNLLTEGDQCKILLDKGILIAERLYRDLIIYLFQIQSFYVEVYFHKKFEVVQGFSSFDCNEQLNPYLNMIDIPVLFD